MTDPITGTTTTTAYTPGVQTTSSLGSSDKDMFLQLLVAQLKYQNPMEPTDPTAFLTQSAQFTMIERLDELAQQGEARILNDEIGVSASLIGKTVEYPDPDGGDEPKSGVVQAVILDPIMPPVFRLTDGTEISMRAVGRITDTPAASTPPTP